MKDVTYAYIGGITKSRDDKGFLHVKGLATDGTLDLDLQMCDPTWLNSAMPAWFKTGNIREMHQLNAVGKATELTQKGSGFEIDAKIVDPMAALKVDEDIYTGFSVGIKGARIDKSPAALEKAPQGIIVGGTIVEVSLVDIPSNPSARLELAKTVGGNLVKTEVVTDGSIPCPTCSGFGETIGDGGAMVTCSMCGGSGEDAPDQLPTNAGGDKNDGEVGLNDEEKAGKPDPDCPTCDGTGKIKDGHVDCPDCVQKTVEPEIETVEPEVDKSVTVEPIESTSKGDEMLFKGLGVSADLIKAASADDATDEQKTALKDEVLKTLGLENVGDITKSQELAQREIASLRAELDDVKKMAAPRDYRLRATEVNQSRISEADKLSTEAERLKTIGLGQTDPTVRAQYVAAAQDYQSKAESIRKSLESDL